VTRARLEVMAAAIADLTDRPNMAPGLAWVLTVCVREAIEEAALLVEDSGLAARVRGLKPTLIAPDPEGGDRE
jgi:hypothetical protein